MADSTGKAGLNVSLSSSLGGKTVYVQSTAETSSSCGVTNLATQTIKTKSGSGGIGSKQPPSFARTLDPGRVLGSAQ